ncbi:hypothetical protein ABIB38_004818 [Massilia sp. UYP11]|uniref:hypothetical protein n=1 Tax=Massilia sp. UYP11 TaxID=1756385 RepID=UPI003D1F05DD
MKQLTDYELNEHYKVIRDLGFEVRVKTYAKNTGTLTLVDSNTKKGIYSVEVKTNGRGTSAIMAILPTTRELTHLDLGLSALARFAQDYDATILRSLSLPGRGKFEKTFASGYNEVVRQHAHEAHEKVKEHLDGNPEAPFSTLFAVFSYELVTQISAKE